MSHPILNRLTDLQNGRFRYPSSAAHRPGWAILARRENPMNSTFAATVDETLATLRRFVEVGDVENALALLATLQPPDQAELLDELDDDSQLTLLPALPPEASADILEEMDDERAAELMAALPTETVIRLVEEMEPDELADLLGEFEPEQAAAVLAGLEDGEEIRPLMLHPNDSAGGLMTSEYLALRRRTTAAAALQAIRDWQPKTDSFSDLFVID
ncbi:MAG: magnesium transporter, partial [Anaerolineales bacterium]|nr:magnesium transporter [Anaerolineales bacterium]